MRKTPIKKNPISLKNWDLKRREGSKAQSDFRQIKNSNRELIFSPHAKRIVSQIPGLIKAFNSLFLSSKINSKKKVFEKVLILKNGTKVNISLEKIKKPTRNSKITDKFYIFKIKSSKVTHTYFVKYYRNHYNSYPGTREMIALDVIRKAGFNVIPAHFSSVDKKARDSFIFYRFQRQLIDAEKAYEAGILNVKEVLNIRKKLKEIESKVNDYFKKKYTSLEISKNLNIRDIYPVSDKSFFSLPVFVDPKSKKLFIFDPIFNIS